MAKKSGLLATFKIKNGHDFLMILLVKNAKKHPFGQMATFIYN